MAKAFKKISTIGSKEQIEVILVTDNFYLHGVALKSDGITLTANTRVTKRTPENPNLSTEGFDAVSFEEGEALYKAEVFRPQKLVMFEIADFLANECGINKLTY